MSILHDMIMIRDVSIKIKHAIQKEMMSTLRAINVLSVVLQFHYTYVRLLRLSPKQHIHVVPIIEHQPGTKVIYDCFNQPQDQCIFRVMVMRNLKGCGWSQMKMRISIASSKGVSSHIANEKHV